MTSADGVRVDESAESSVDGVFVVTLDGVIQSWHPAAERLYGYGAEQTRGRSIELLDVPGEGHFREHLNAAASGLMSRFEAVHVGRDGRRVEVELTFAPIRDSAGTVAGAWCATRDITERKRAERELTRMAAAAEYGTDAVVSIDLDGRVRHWNQGAERLYGIPEEAAIGSTIGEINALTGQPEEANARARDAIAHVARGDPAYCMEARRRRRDGTIVDVLTTVMPWHVDGRVVGVTTTAVDISERKRIEEATASLAAIVDASDDAIVGRTLDGQIKSWNPAAKEIYGYTAAEAVGKNVSMLLAPGQEDELAALLTRVSRGERVSHLETTRRRKDGRLIEVSLTISPIRDRQGRIVGAATIARDVTERNARERELGRLAQAAEYGTDAVLSIDLDGRVRHWNHGAERLYGYSAQEAIGHDLGELTLIDSIDEHMERVRGGASPYQYEAQRRRKDGTIIDILTNVVPWHVDGQLVGVTGVTIDMTERKRAERTAARLAAIVESTDDAIVTYSPEAVIETWNAAAERLSGYGAGEAIGQRRGLTAAEGPKREPFEQALGGRTARYESRLRRRDGVIIDIGITLSAVRGADGAIVGVSCIWRDITERKQIERELRESQSRLRSLLDHAPTLIYMLDLDGRFVVINDELERILGVPREQVLGRVREQVLPADAAAQHRANDLEALREGKAITFEEALSQPDGEHVYRSVKFPLRDQDGRIFGLGGISSDVTDQRAAEREFERLAQAAHHVTDAIISYDLDRRIRRWSAGAESVFGFSAQEVIGLSQVEFDALSGEPVDAHRRTPEIFARAMAGETVSYEGRRRHKDGAVIDLQATLVPWRVDGTIVGVTSTTVDITERKRAERAREQALAELEEAQRLARVGSWSWDPEIEEATWSAQMYELFGRDRALGPAIGDALLPYIHPKDRRRVKERYDLGARSEPELELEFRISTEQGEERVVHAVGRDDPSRPGRSRGTVQDVTDQRRAEAERSELLQTAARADEARRLNAELEQRVAARTAELERANGELETFAYSVSHDLRAPLRAVDGFSLLLYDECGDELGEQGRHYLERIRAGAVRMGELIDAVLELSRLSRRRLVREQVDLSALASEIAAELQRAEPDRQVDVEIQDGLLADADLALVRSMLQNLLANAYKFTCRTEHARVRVGAVGDSVVPVFFVADNGAGFDMAHAKSLFRPFHRLHQNREFPGEGIGLATVVRAAHRHGGVVWANGAVNQGATFCFSLMPGAQPPPNAATGEDVIPSWQPTDQGTDND